MTELLPYSYGVIVWLHLQTSTKEKQFFFTLNHTLRLCHINFSALLKCHKELSGIVSIYLQQWGNYLF